jgi:hypothetical protein
MELKVTTDQVTDTSSTRQRVNLNGSRLTGTLTYDRFS